MSDNKLDIDSIRPRAEDKSSQVIAELEKKKEAMSDSKTEERFYWVFIIFIVVDILTFQNMETWGGPVSIFTLELIFLIVFGRKCGVDDIYEITERLLSLVGKLNGKNDPK